jgi:hypothetical protein
MPSCDSLNYQGSVSPGPPAVMKTARADLEKSDLFGISHYLRVVFRVFRRRLDDLALPIL